MSWTVGARVLLASALFVACAGAGNASPEPAPTTAPSAPTTRSDRAPPSDPTPLSQTADDECAPKHVCEGSISPMLLQELRLVAAETRGCYERALRDDPKLAGRVGVAVRVRQSGQTCGAQFVERSFAMDERFEQCVLTVFSRNYPAPEGGCLNAVVPLNFQLKDAYADAGAAPTP